MEREVSSATWLAISMIALSAFIGIVLWTVYLGRVQENEIIADASDLVSDMENGELSSFLDSTENLSMAAIYNIMTRNYSNISQVVIYKCTEKKNLATAYDTFNKNKSEETPGNISNTTMHKWETNGKSSWQCSYCGSTKTVLMSYEILSQENIINGRGYIVVNKLSSGTYRVKILQYN